MPVQRVVKPKGLPFPELPSGPLMDHEQELLDAIVRSAVDKKIRRPPNNFMLFRSWAIRCHKNPEAKLEHLPEDVATEFRARGAGYAAEAWKRITSDGKAYWTMRSRITANAHALHFPGYQYRPIHQPKEVKDAKKQKQLEERLRKGLPIEPPKPRKARNTKALTPCDSQAGTPASSSVSIDEHPIATLPYPLTPSSCVGSFTPAPPLSLRPQWHWEDRYVTEVTDDWNHFQPPQPEHRRGSFLGRRSSSVPLEYAMRQDTSKGSLELSDMPNIARTLQPQQLSGFVEQNFQFPAKIHMPQPLPAASAFEACVGAQAQAEATMASSSTIKFIDPFNPSSEIPPLQTYGAPLSPYIPPAAPCALDESYPMPNDAQYMAPAFDNGFERSSLGLVGMDQAAQYPLATYEPYPQLDTAMYAPPFDENATLELLGTVDIEQYLSDTQPSSESSSPYNLHSATLGIDELELSSPAPLLLSDDFSYGGPF